mmetsp:Transcript_1240/g.2266  ORF Transcript_1240/g.2266 Transcript_1240/m.2266 type:complete len:300 (-) Transcript_1240:130-1029(-)
MSTTEDQGNNSSGCRTPHMALRLSLCRSTSSPSKSSSCPRSSHRNHTNTTTPRSLPRSPRSPSPPPEPCQQPIRHTSRRTLFHNNNGDNTMAPSPETTTTMICISPNGGGRQSSSFSSPTSTTTTTVSPRLPARDPAEEQSIALARMLMEQEAMESYAMSADLLRANAANYSAEDLEALQAVLAEDEASEYLEDEPEDEELNYDMMLRLGECIGDVKQERWALESRRHIERLKTFRFDPAATKKLDENDSRCKCLICQFPYEPKDQLRSLPCGHCFHVDCVDQWLRDRNACPYCRQPIV